MVLLDVREVDGMDGNMMVLLVGGEELNKDTVRGAAGRERGGWDGWDEWEHGGGTDGESGAG